MPLDLKRPITYLVTSGKTALTTTPKSSEFSDILKLIEAAVNAEVSLIQLREKVLRTCVLQELASKAVELTRGTNTCLLINERFDVALAAGADGVHLSSKSIPPDVVRRVVGENFLIGVSTHSLGEALEARDRGADFVLFGPVFQTESKRAFGPPQGIPRLRDVTHGLKSFPVIAIGGVNLVNAKECIDAGAAGIAAISMFENPGDLGRVTTSITDS